MQISKKTVRETIYEALVSAWNDSRIPVSRELLVDVTGFKKTVIDEHLSKLVDDEQSVIRVKSGFFQPALKFHESRSLSRTLLPSGLVKFELGDSCMNLNPEEDRMLSHLWGGGSRFAEAEAMQMLRATQAELAVELNRAKRETSALRERLLQLENKAPQLDLALS